MTKLCVAILAIGMMAGCTSQPSQPAPAEKAKPQAPEAITGWRGFHNCYIPARGWAGDAKLYRLQSQPSATANGRDGKSTTWRAGFASASMGETRTYTWSNGDVMPGAQDTYSPTNTSTKVFDIAFLKIDSDQALQTAQKHGGDKQPADTPAIFVLDWDRSSNGLVWHVIYGPDLDNAKLRIAVNASSGDFIRVEK